MDFGGLYLFLVLLWIDKVPLIVKYVITGVMVLMSFPLLLNLTFADNSSHRSYPARFKEKFTIIDHSNTGESTIDHHVAYLADNGRTQSMGVSSDEYYTESYPDTITLHEQRGLFGLEVDSDVMSFTTRLGWLCMALSLFWIAAIAAYSQYNLVFTKWKGLIAIGIMIIAMAMFNYNPHTDTAYIVIITSLLALALAVILSVNYLRITDSHIEYVEIHDKKAFKNPYRGIPNKFQFTLCTESGRKIICNTDDFSYDNALDGCLYPLQIDMGCIGMPVVKPRPYNHTPPYSAYGSPVHANYAPQTQHKKTGGCHRLNFIASFGSFWGLYGFNS